MPRAAMSAAATANSCSYSSYSQVQEIAKMNNIQAGLIPAAAGGGGICYGLAVAWLERKLKGGSDKFLSDARDWKSDVFPRSHLFWANQQNDMWKTLTGLSAAQNENGGDKKKNFECPDETSDFVEWIGGSLKTRYFLVHTPGHCMAACGSKTGKLEFFDPNAGIVSSMIASRLVGCLNQYFGAAPMRTAYQTSPFNRVILKVEKFKAA
jgi:hypothetical protein